MSQKSYDNSPTLYLIPTPIGNLDDISIRCLNTLKEVDVIFSEDTRVTSLLLSHFEISKKLVSSHSYNEDVTSNKLIDYLNKILEKNRSKQAEKQAKSIALSLDVCTKEYINIKEKVIALEESFKEVHQSDKEETKSVPDDKEFDINLMNKLEIVDTVVEKEKKLQRLNKSGKLDKYLDKIGCREEDKPMYKELLGCVSDISDGIKEFTKVKIVTK